MRKIVFVSSITSILSLLAVASMAQRPEAPSGKRDDLQGGRGSPPPPPSRPLEAVDANHDGELSAEEIARASQAFLQLDRNGDGKLDREKEVKGPVDLIFLDADKTGYVDYLEKLLPLVRPGGLIVAHNMNEQHADPAYVKALTTNPNLETVFLNLATSGIGVTLKKR